MAACSGSEEDAVEGEGVDRDGGVDNDRADAGPIDDGGGEGPDASTGDGDGGEPSLDASTDDASTHDVSDAGDAAIGPAEGFRVTVFGHAGPIPDVDVFLHAADGTLQGTRRTDEAGQVYEEQAPGAVTVRDRYSNAITGQRLITYLATENGDDLVIWLNDRIFAELPADRTFSLDYPADPPGAAFRYDVQFGAQCLQDQNPGDPNPQQLMASPTCMNEDNAFLAAAISEDEELLAYAWSTNPIADPGAGGSAMVPLAGWDSATLGVTLANLPDHLNDYASVSLTMDRLNMAFDTLQDPNQSWLDALQGDTMNFFYAPGFAEILTARTWAVGESDWVVRTDQVRSGDENTSYTFDYDLPRFNSMDAVGTPGDVTISWELSAPLPDADVQFTLLQWSQVEWLVVVPPDLTSFAFPKLVSGTVLEPVVPVHLPEVVAAFNDTGITGYTQFKQRPLVLGDFGFGTVAGLPVHARPSGAEETLQIISIEPVRL